MPCASRSATSFVAADVTASSVPIVQTCTWYGARLIGHRMPFSSWCCSIAVATRRDTPMP